MIEAALVMGFLVFIFFSSIDLFFLSAAYSTYSQIAREGVLSGIRMDSLFNEAPNASCSTDPSGVSHSNLQVTNPNYLNCYANDTTTCGHYLVQWKLKKALDTYRSSRITNPGITTRCMVGAAKSIEVQLEASYSGYSPVFQNLTIRVRQRGEMVS